MPGKWKNYVHKIVADESKGRDCACRAAPKEQAKANLSGKEDFYLTQLWRVLARQATYEDNPARKRLGKLSGSRTEQTQMCLLCPFLIKKVEAGRTEARILET